MKLPFKTDADVFPNNLSVAEQRIRGLKKRLFRNQAFHCEYKARLEDVISRVPQPQLKQPDGKVLYIPHHGVRHLKKGTLRVVFDCGAEFKGTSLNNQLLQGPNLTSSLVGVLTSSDWSQWQLWSI